jgi:hypothetical protein
MLPVVFEKYGFEESVKENKRLNISRFATNLCSSLNMISRMRIQNLIPVFDSKFQRCHD